MGMPVLVFGKSGSGKSRSLKNFAEDEILFINVENKMLPFRKKFKYEIVPKSDQNATSLQRIFLALDKMPCNTAVIDDCGYLMTHYFMDHHREKSGNLSFEMYDSIADIIYNLVQYIKNNLPPKKIVYLLFHEETDDYGNTKIRTIGKLIDSKVVLEGMVTICIRCASDNGKHYFLTQTDGKDVVKSPEEMFKDKEIDNDLKAVDAAIREYYGLTNKKKEEKTNE